ERGTLGERNKKIVDKPGLPVFVNAVPCLLRLLDLHLRKYKTAAPELVTTFAVDRTTTIQAPIPKREHEYIGKPEFDARQQQTCSRFFMRRQRPNEQEYGSD